MIENTVEFMTRCHNVEYISDKIKLSSYIGKGELVSIMGSNCLSMIESFLESNGMIWPAMLSFVPGCKVMMDTDRTVLSFKSQRFSMPTHVFDAYVHATSLIMSDYDEPFMDLFHDLFLSHDSIEFDAQAFLKKIQPDVGQAKILVGCLETMPGLQKDIVVLAIGSSSHSLVKAGITYDVIARMLDYLGYSGTIVCFDKYEVATTYKLGNVSIVKIESLFDYATPYKYKGRAPDIIWDDGWLPINRPVQELKAVVYQPLPPLEATDPMKFLACISHDRKSMVCVVKDTTSDHSDIQCPVGHIIIGGAVVHGRMKEVYGSSTTYGGISRYNAEMLFPGYTVGNISSFSRLELDPDRNLEKNHPNARISMKYLGEPYPNDGKYRVVEQEFYTGRERRLFFNVPLSEHVLPFGDGCRSCLRIGRACGGIISYTGADSRLSVTMALASVLPETCTAMPGRRFAKVMETVLSYLRQKSSYESLITRVGLEHMASVEYINRILYLLAYQGVITIKTVDRFLDMKGYNKKAVLPKGAHRVELPVRIHKTGDSYIQTDIAGKMRRYNMTGEERPSQELVITMQGYATSTTTHLTTDGLKSIGIGEYAGVVVDDNLLPLINPARFVNVATGKGVLAVSSTYVESNDLILVNPANVDIVNAQRYMYLVRNTSNFQHWKRIPTNVNPDLPIGPPLPTKVISSKPKPKVKKGPKPKRRIVKSAMVRPISQEDNERY